MSDVPDLNNPIAAQCAVFVAVLEGLLQQGVADRTRLIQFLEELVVDLSAEERDTAYGYLLQKVITALEQMQQFPAPSWPSSQGS